MDPLVRRAPLRAVRGGVWGLLVLAAFTLAAGAAAAEPLFGSAAGDAALADQLAVVPADAVASQAPVVRLVGGTGLPGRGLLDGALDDIPGLGPSAVTAASVSVETRPLESLLSPYVEAGGTRERARLYGDDDLAHALVPVATAPAGTAGTAGGVWLPEPLADKLSVRPGDRVRVGLDTRFRDRSTPAVVAGIYAVGPDGRTPKDPPGTHRWSYRRAALPVDSEFGVLPANLLVTDVAGATALAAPIGDDLLYAVESQLDPVTPTLAQAQQTVDGIRDLQVEVRDPTLAGERPDRLRQQVVSGLPTLVGEARLVADRTVAWTRPLLLAGLLLGLATIGCVALLTANRRAVEVRLGVALGQRPSTAGGLAALEVLPGALLSVLLGPLLAWFAVWWVGPPAGVSAAALTEGAVRAALAAGIGCVLVAVIAVVVAWRAERLRVGAGRSSVPWDVALVLVALTATVGLVVRPDESGPPSALDLLVPLLLVAAVGAAVGRGGLTLLARVAGRARSVSGTLALSRASAGRRQGALVVTVLTAGLGMLAYALAAAESVTTVTQDRSAVRAGANASAEIEVSWLLDPGAAQLPPPQPGDPAQPSLNAVPGARTPPLPDGTTIVWRGRVSVPPELGNLDLLVIDPAHFEQVAAWGTGPELARAHEQVRRLAREDAVVAKRVRDGERYGPVPAIGVGDVVSRPGETAGVTSQQGDIPVRFLDVVPAFPGHQDELGMVVVPADSFFLYLGALDPRVKPPEGSGRFNRAPSDYFPSLWSADGVAGIRAVTDPAGMKIDRTTTLAQVAQEPDLVAARRSTGAQVALGGCVAAVAVLVLVMYAERRAALARAADLMLARMGLRRRGVLRARAVELAVLTLLAAAAAALGAALLGPLGGRLLDPGGGAEPAFHLRLDLPGALAVLAVAAVAWLCAVGLVAWRARRVDEGKVLRDAE